ncbi:hypothetical protein C8Q77DRAFT_613600 [Trametes polyzona]|nr:hypothetical protein C8Q77DRAFT_613600 [Trametes polyzona]
MSTQFRRPLPNRIPSRSYSVEDFSDYSRAQFSHLSTPSTGSSTQVDTPSEPLRSNEVFVYYDSAWSTDEVCLPPVRERRGEHYRPDVARRPRPRAATIATVREVSVTAAPTKARPLVKVVGKAKGLAKVVARRSIRRLRKKGEVAETISDSSSVQHVNTPASEEWDQTGTTTVSGIAIVVTAEKQDGAEGTCGLVPKPSRSRFSLQSSDCPALPASSSGKPQLSEMSALPTPPQIAEQDAFQILYILKYGDLMLPHSDDEDDSTENFLPGQLREHARVQPAHDPQSADELLSTSLHMVLFLPWCITVGAAIVLMPSTVGAITFDAGIIRGPAPGGLRRFAYWAANAYEHVFVFLATAVLLLYHFRAPWTAALLFLRWAWVWVGFRPSAGLYRRVGWDDMESIWLVFKGRAVVDAVMAAKSITAGDAQAVDECCDGSEVPGSLSCSKECDCHGTCLLRCPEFGQAAAGAE